MAESKQERRQRAGNMGGMTVTLPDGRVLQVDAEGKPVKFTQPASQK